MAEQSIRIADAASGLRMAVRDAFEKDGAANDRVIERVDFASGKFPSPIGNPIRGSGGAITAVDTFDMTNLPADLLSNLINVGDKSMLCVSVEQTVSGGTVTITPILFDDESTPNVVGILPARIFVQQYAFRRGSSSGNYVLPALTWDVCGAHKIGLHLSAITGTSNGVALYGWVL